MSVGILYPRCTAGRPAKSRYQRFTSGKLFKLMRDIDAGKSSKYKNVGELPEEMFMNPNGCTIPEEQPE